MTRGEEDLWYVYGLAEQGLPRRLQVRGHALRTLRVGEIDAIVRRAGLALGRDPDTLRDQHGVMVGLAARAPALLPARFGTVLEEQRLRSIVARYRGEITDALERVRGRDQMTVRVFGTPQPLESRSDPPSTGTEFLERRRAASQGVPPEAALIHRVLGAHAAAERLESGRGGLRLTVFHLVDRGALEDYRERAARLPGQLSPHRVAVTGPWPAFAFAPDLF